jgi:hypothetical protein
MEPTKEQIIHERLLNKQERERIEAWQSHNCIKYSRLCDELGVEPEDQLLYEHGQAEIMQIGEKARSNGSYKNRQALEEVLADKEKMLAASRSVGNSGQQRAWLRRMGYDGVNVAGYSQPVPLSTAPKENVYGFYMAKKKELEAEVQRLKQHR